MVHVNTCMTLASIGEKIHHHINTGNITFFLKTQKGNLLLVFSFIPIFLFTDIK